MTDSRLDPAAERQVDPVEEALNRYHEAYHTVFPQGGDAADHDEAHREGICAALQGAGLLPGQDGQVTDEEWGALEALREKVRRLEEALAEARGGAAPGDARRRWTVWACPLCDTVAYWLPPPGERPYCSNGCVIPGGGGPQKCEGVEVVEAVPSERVATSVAAGYRASPTGTGAEGGTEHG